MYDWTLEASLAELFDDPLVELVMKSDGVDRGCVERLLATVGHERARIAMADAQATD
jgi:hypothetical protein